MSYRESVPSAPARAAIALTLALLLLATGAHWDHSADDTAPAHGPHALNSVWAAEVGVVTDHQHPVVEHPHVQDASNQVAHESFSATVLRRAVTGLVALGLFLVALTMAPLWRQLSQSGARGPPRLTASILSGRVLLTRLCIARR